MLKMRECCDNTRLTLLAMFVVEDVLSDTFCSLF